MSKRDQWRKTVNEQLSINDKERQSVRRIMSRLRGNSADEPKTDTPAVSAPVQILDRSIIDTPTETIPVQILDQSNSLENGEPTPLPLEIPDQSSFETGLNSIPVTEPITKFESEIETGVVSQKIDTPIEIRPVPDLDQSNNETPAESRPAQNPDQSKSLTSPKSRPVKSSTVTESRPVQNLDRSKEKRAGYLRLPNEVLDDVLPRLSPAEAVIFLRLYRLSVGFGNNRCMVGMTSLTQACNISEQTCRTAIRRLIDMGHIRQVEVINTREIKGTTYEILTGLENIPVKNLDRSDEDTGLKTRPIKDHDHEDLLKTDHHQSAHERETMTAYQSITGNKWGRADRFAYQQIAKVPVDQIERTIREVLARAPQKPATLAYFVKEILNPTPSNPTAKTGNRARLRAIIDRLSQANVGRQYTLGELADDTKLACARDGVAFDNDLFNEIIASRSRSGD